MKRRLVLFDIDGTLLLSRGAGRRAILVAMEEWLSSTDLARVGEVRFDGKTDPQIVSELLRAAGVADPDHPARIDQVLTRYLLQLEIELARPDHVTQVLPGIPDLLSRIEATADGILGLLTGNIATGAYSPAELTAAGAAAAFRDLSDTAAVMAAIWN